MGEPCSPDGVIQTIAGTGIVGYNGDWILGTSATLHTGTGISVDAFGNIYVADRYNHRVRKLLSNGTITTFAGMGSKADGASANGVLATSTNVSYPTSTAVDTSGNVYIVEQNNNRVRKVWKTNGIIVTVAGTGAQGFAGDGGPATSALLSIPSGVAVDIEGNIFIADGGNCVIRKVFASNGTIVTVAGTPGACSYSGDGGPATSAKIRPVSVAVDSQGSIFIADQLNCRIRKVSPSGIITTVAGTGPYGYSGENTMATASALRAPSSVAVDGSGNVYFTDFETHLARVIFPNGTLTTIAGDYKSITRQEGAPANVSMLVGPWHVAFDLSGNLIFAESSVHRVSKLFANGSLVTLAGIDMVAGFNGDGSDAKKAQMSLPSGLFADHLGNVFVAERSGHRVRKIFANGTITTVMGTGSSAAFQGDGRLATETNLNSPASVYGDKAGNLYVAVFGGHRICKVLPNGTIYTIAGNGTAGVGGNGHPATSTMLNNPIVLFLDNLGNLIISDQGNSCVKKLFPNGTIVVVAGICGTKGFSGDGGLATKATFFLPWQISVDLEGNIIIADRGNHHIRKVFASTRIIVSLVGQDYGLFSTDGVPATSAFVNGPNAAVCDLDGNLVIADTYNHRIRLVNGVCPPLYFWTSAKSPFGTILPLFDKTHSTLKITGQFNPSLSYICKLWPASETVPSPVLSSAHMKLRDSVFCGGWVVPAGPVSASYTLKIYEKFGEKQLAFVGSSLPVFKLMQVSISHL